MQQVDHRIFFILLRFIRRRGNDHGLYTTVHAVTVDLNGINGGGLCGEGDEEEA
jgi:hypothetical protein